jgi:predicted PurR-regulated permease PerM
MVPFLGYVVVAAVALAAARGAVSAALVIWALGFLVLFAGDKIVRPMLVGGAIRLGFVWVLMASLGGLELLGLLGLFVGPVVLALGGALWDDWTKNRGRSRVTRVDAALSEHA